MNETTQSPDDTGHSARADAYPWLTAYPEGIDWDRAFDPTPVPAILDAAAERHPDKVCTDFLGQTTSYAEILALADRAAAGLQRLGVTKGTKVGLLLPNSPTAIIYYHGILKAGGIVVNCNPLYTVEELASQVEDSDTELMISLDLKVLFDKVEALIESGALARAVVCSFPALLPTVKSLLFRTLKARDLAKPSESRVGDKLVFEDVLLDNDGTIGRVDIDVEDLAVLQYTGGTTGRPKGAMLTHANLTINVQQIDSWAPKLLDGAEKMMAVLPFFHVFAMTGVMNYGLSRAAELVIMPRFELDDMLKLITRHKATVMAGVPTIFNAVINHPKIKSYDLSSLKLCLSGGAALPLEVKREFESVTGCDLVEAYGLSETSPGATINPLDGPVKEGSIGQPLPGTILSIRDIEDPTKEMPLGENGEICIAGPQVMKGYWQRPQETADIFVGEFLRTGDVGHMDEEGFTFIVDRMKDLIICSGYNVYPRQIEEAIYAFPAVEEVTVIGIPDDYRGEAPKAFVRLKSGTSASVEEIFEFLKSKLSKIEMPEEIEFRDELPKTMIGKLSKKELKQEHAERNSK